MLPETTASLATASRAPLHLQLGYVLCVSYASTPKVLACVVEGNAYIPLPESRPDPSAQLVGIAEHIHAYWSMRLYADPQELLQTLGELLWHQVPHCKQARTAQ